MSQFEHESDDQSEALNKLIRDGHFESGAAIIAAMREREQFQNRREAYRRPDSRRHLQDELYKGIYGALVYLQKHLKAIPEPSPLDPWERRYSYVVDPVDHATRSIHAMIHQELDLYLEAHDAFIVSEIKAMRDKMKEGDLG